MGPCISFKITEIKLVVVGLWCVTSIQDLPSMQLAMKHNGMQPFAV